jgi:enamine deaminase RidA (YjgF/YER057c/UK114 family)
VAWTAYRIRETPSRDSPYREARNHFFATVTPPAAPAVTLVEVSKLYGPDFMIEIEAIAAA